MESGPQEIPAEPRPSEAAAKERNPSGLFYECISCGSKLTADQLAMTPEIKCPFCGYRILRKVRPPIVKHLKTK